jgi:HPr kinase/phosphorylase
MSQVNIRQLFEDKQVRLELTRVAGNDGVDRIIDSKAVEASNRELVSHLSRIHPSWVQVLSQTELDYLRNLSLGEREKVFEQIEQNGTTCLIVAGCVDIPQELISFANKSSIPLFASATPSVHLMWLIRHYLGKSELGLELVTRGSGLVADDVVELYRITPDTLEGRCPDLLRDFLEVRGLGMLNIRTMFGETAVRRKKSLKLIVHLHRAQEGELSQMERLPLVASHQEILGVKINTVKIPVVAGRNLAVLVEAAARNFVLQQRGINTMQEFISRHDQMLLEE